MNYKDVWKTSEIQTGTLTLRRRVRLVTYIVGSDADGNEHEIEVSDEAAQAVMDAVKEANNG